jgi:hypothetical protein
MNYQEGGNYIVIAEMSLLYKVTSNPMFQSKPTRDLKNQLKMVDILIFSPKEPTIILSDIGIKLLTTQFVQN